MIWQVPEIWEIMAAMKLVGLLELIGFYLLGVALFFVILAYNFQKDRLCASWRIFKTVLAVNFSGVLLYGFLWFLLFLYPRSF